MIFAIAGATITAGILLWFTFWFIGLHFMTGAVAGWKSALDGWPYSLLWLIAIVAGWWGWLVLVKHSFNISIHIS